MKYTVYHGTTDPETDFKYIDNSYYVAYFSDSLELATEFAKKEDIGGLIDDEVATIIEAKIALINPLVVSEDQWEEVGDITAIEKDNLIAKGYDGILCTNDSNCTYFVVFNTSQIEITARTFI